MKPRLDGLEPGPNNSVPLRRGTGTELFDRGGSNPVPDRVRTELDRVREMAA